MTQIIEDFKEKKTNIFEKNYTSEILSETEIATRVDQANQMLQNFLEKNRERRKHKKKSKYCIGNDLIKD